ncbi:hypothetical protein QNO07_27040 [Streptomyces sp. 549]|uniref:hypothetical protein n=1 Tax=Streptomyces sp. 549 TaxID=3049076 RepID=UPI0024C400F2|nr:hypothetical protein [Streptomyces sp. 549]MDK1477006.1 hypothetical protein [Streptomyces sp. 549]
MTGQPLPLRVAMQIPEVINEMTETLAKYGGTVERSALDDGLRRCWAEAEPETRACVLLTLAWSAQGDDIPLSDDTAGVYADDFGKYVEAFEGDSEAWHGKSFPMMPLPGTAGTLASSLGFDREETDLTLKTALLLKTSIYRDPTRMPSPNR